MVVGGPTITHASQQIVRQGLPVPSGSLPVECVSQSRRGRPLSVSAVESGGEATVGPSCAIHLNV